MQLMFEFCSSSIQKFQVHSVQFQQKSSAEAILIDSGRILFSHSRENPEMTITCAFRILLVIPVILKTFD